jgi:GLPGLI family protein
MKTTWTYFMGLFFLVGIGHAQQNNICGTFKYKQVTSIAYNYQETYILSFNNQFSYAEETDIEKSDAKTVKETNDIGVTQNYILPRKNITPAYYFNDLNEFYFSVILDDDILVVKEDEFSWDWELHDETKSIANFLCQKATTHFRGRIYTAWFAQDIPVKFGPWKFHGLPGLILEVYDENYYFHLQPQTLSIQSGINCNFNVNKIDKTKALSIKNYLIKLDDYAQELMDRLSSKLPKGSAPLKLDKNCQDCNSKSIEIFNH